MRLPGLTAEASLYQSVGRYHMTWSAGAAGQGTTVAPAGCGFWQTLGCAGALLACSADCALDPNKWDCLACFAGWGASSCWNCLPGTGDGGGGSGGGGVGGGGGGGVTSHRCCPPGRRCCGTCQKVAGGTMCDDVCVGPREVCP